MYTFSFIVGGIVPKSVKRIHSAAKHLGTLEPKYTLRAWVHGP